MKKDTILYVVAGLMIIAQGVLLYFVLNPKTPDLSPFERAIERNNLQIERNEAIMNEISDKIGNYTDTLIIIKNQKQTIRETFYKDITRLIANDSTNRALQYKNDIREAHQYLFSGRYFER